MQSRKSVNHIWFEENMMQVSSWLFMTYGRIDYGYYGISVLKISHHKKKKKLQDGY